MKHQKIISFNGHVSELTDAICGQLAVDLAVVHIRTNAETFKSFCEWGQSVVDFSDPSEVAYGAKLAKFHNIPIYLDNKLKNNEITLECQNIETDSKISEKAQKNEKRLIPIVDEPVGERLKKFDSLSKQDVDKIAETTRQRKTQGWYIPLTCAKSQQQVGATKQKDSVRIDKKASVRIDKIEINA